MPLQVLNEKKIIFCKNWIFNLKKQLKSSAHRAINCQWGHTGTEKDLNPSPFDPKFNPQPLQPPQPELKCHHSLLVTIQFSFGSNKLAWMHLSQKTTRCLKFVSSEGKQEIRKYLGIEREKEKSQHQAGFELTNTIYAIYRFLTTTAPSIL